MTSGTARSSNGWRNISFSSALPVVAVCGLAVGGILAPRLALRLGEAPGRRLIGLRGGMSARLVDVVHGVADLLAYEREGAHARALAVTSRDLVTEQGRLVRASALGGSLAVLAADLTTVAVLVLAIPTVHAGELDGVKLATVALLTLAAFEAAARSDHRYGRGCSAIRPAGASTGSWMPASGNSNRKWPSTSSSC